MYENVKYHADVFTKEIATIQVVINGVTWFVPLDPTNKDYQNIMKLVEEDKLVIQPADNEEK